MRYTRLAAVAAFFLSVSVLAGCAAVGSINTGPASFSTTATRICAVVQPALLSVNAEAKMLQPPLSLDQQTALQKATTASDTFCAATTSATTQTAQGMMNNVFPVVMGVIANSSLDDKSRNALLLSLVGVQTAANVLLAQNQPAAPAQ